MKCEGGLKLLWLAQPCEILLGIAGYQEEGPKYLQHLLSSQKKKVPNNSQPFAGSSTVFFRLPPFPAELRRELQRSLARAKKSNPTLVPVAVSPRPDLDQFPGY